MGGPVRGTGSAWECELRLAITLGDELRLGEAAREARRSVVYGLGEMFGAGAGAGGARAGVPLGGVRGDVLLLAELE